MKESGVLLNTRSQAPAWERDCCQSFAWVPLNYLRKYNLNTK